MNRNINHSVRCHCSNFNLRADLTASKATKANKNRSQDERHKTHTHTRREGEKGEKQSWMHMQHVQLQPRLFADHPLPRLHSLPACLASCWAFSLLNSCRCYWDKKIYWLRMFFVTDFDLCAFYMFGASIFYLNSFCLATSQRQQQRIPSYSTKWICFKCCNSNERARRWLGWLLMINNWKVVKALRIKAAQSRPTRPANTL